MPPPVTTGLVVHYDADAITGLTDLDPVSQWDDLSGSGLHAVQATGANQPTYRAGILNGMAVVDFDGTNDFLAAPNFGTALAQPNTIFLVGKIDDDTPAAAQRFISTNLDTGIHGFHVTVNSVWTATAGGGQTESVWPVDTKPHYFTLIVDGASSLGRVDNSTLKGLQTLGTHSYAGVRLGANQVPGGFLDGYLAEVLVYNRRLTLAEINDVGDYLQDKWFPARTTTGPTYTRYEMLGDLTLTSGVDTTVNEWNVHESSGSLPVTDNGDGTFTVNQTGIYRIVGGSDYPGATEGLFTRRVAVEVNSVQIAGRSLAGNSGDSFSTADTGPISLTVNDVIRLRAYQDSGLTDVLQASSHVAFLTIQQLDTNYKRYGLSANQSITQNTATLVDFDVEDETGGTTNLTLNADGSVTVNEVGIYRMRASMDWAIPTNQNARRYLEIVVNKGSDVVRSALDIGRDAEDGLATADTGPMSIGVGDVVKVNVYQNCDATLNLEDTRATWLTIEKLPSDTAFKRWELINPESNSGGLSKTSFDDTPTESNGSLAASMSGSSISFSADDVYEAIISCEWASDDLGHRTGVNITEEGFDPPFGGGLAGRLSYAATRAGDTAGPQRGVATTGPWNRKTTDPNIVGAELNGSGAARNLLANDRTFLTVLEVADFGAFDPANLQASVAGDDVTLTWDV